MLNESVVTKVVMRRWHSPVEKKVMSANVIRRRNRIIGYPLCLIVPVAKGDKPIKPRVSE